MTIWVVIVAVGAGSFLLRVGPLLLLQRRVLPAAADRTIGYAGLAAISGLIGVSVQRGAHGSSTVPTLISVAAAAALATRGRSVLWIILVGGGTYATSLAVVAIITR